MASFGTEALRAFHRLYLTGTKVAVLPIQRIAVLVARDGLRIRG